MLFTVPCFTWLTEELLKNESPSKVGSTNSVAPTALPAMHVRKGWNKKSFWLFSRMRRQKSPLFCAPSCELEFDKKRATKPKFVAQSRPTLYFSQQLSSTRNKSFCCATSWLRTGNIDQNLQRNNVARQVEGFSISYFAALAVFRSNVLGTTLKGESFSPT